MREIKHDRLSTVTRDEPPGQTAAGEPGPKMPCLTIACHPDPSRVGERLLLSRLLAGQTQALSRRDGLFCLPELADRCQDGDARPLADPYVTRQPALLGRRGAGHGIHIVCGKAITHVAGEPTQGAELTLGPEQISHGVSLRMSKHTLLWLHVRRESANTPVHDIIGDSDGVRALRHAIATLARWDDPVLIGGESGTGKELVARALHAMGPRAGGPFVAVNMATLHETLAASTLFGHVRGAFTGADRTLPGLFEQAEGGVLFLDEIGETPPAVQAMLLRALESARVTPLGATRDRAVNVRVVAATDRNLDQAVSEGTFRAPLLYRLACQRLKVPALRKRREDLGRLVVHFANAWHDEVTRTGWGGDIPPVSATVSRAAWIDSLLQQRLPGNVRELRYLVRAACMGLPPQLGGDASSPSPDALQAATPGDAPARVEARRRVDDATLMRALAANGFVVERAAKQLGIASSTIHYFIRRSGKVRRATDLPDEELRQALCDAHGDLGAAAQLLCVSQQALVMTLRRRPWWPAAAADPEVP